MSYPTIQEKPSRTHYSQRGPKQPDFWTMLFSSAIVLFFVLVASGWANTEIQIIVYRREWNAFQEEYAKKFNEAMKKMDEIR